MTSLEEKDEKDTDTRRAGNDVADTVCPCGMHLSEQDVKQILSIISKGFERAEVIMEVMNPWAVKNIKEKSIEKTKAKFTWGVKSGKELQRISPEYTWVRDVSLVEGMKIIMPAYNLFGWIPAVKNISNKLVVLRKG